MESFFLTGSFFDSEELRELLLRRYHSLSFMDDMSLFEFVEFVNTAREKDLEEKLYMQWCGMLPTFEKYIAFSEFKDTMLGHHIDMRPAEEIIAEIDELHAKKGEVNGT